MNNVYKYNNISIDIDMDKVKNGELILLFLKDIEKEEKDLIDSLQSIQKKKKMYLNLLNEIMSVPCPCGKKQYPQHACEALTVYKCDFCKNTNIV